MSGSESVDQAARDDAHLRSLGIKPELRRSLGFVANFALAFSYISVSTGTFTNQAVAFGVGGPAIFWAWPLVILGQTFVALNFAELASHFPVAGSIYQWSKRLSNRTLGWFTGWIYFWAGVITVTAVAATVPLVMSTIWPDQIKLGDPSPIGALDMQSFIGLTVLLSTTIINVAGVRLLTTINNIGVGAEIVGMLVFALILLFFANHQSPAVLFDTSYTSNLADGSYFPVFLVGAFMALFVVYGFDTAGTFGEETVDASRQSPRGLLAAVWLSGLVGAIFLLAVTLSFQDMTAAIATGQAFGFPIADTIKQNLTFAVGGLTLGDLYLVVILIAVYVCTLAIHGATVRLMFSMGRDRRLPLGGLWGHVNHTLRTPANAGIMVAILAAIPFIVTGAGSAIYIAIAATGMIYIAYFLCNFGVLIARRRGWPHQGAWFNLGSWGTILNVFALVWGAFMVVNIAIWTDPKLFGVFGNDLRNTWSNPFINTFIKVGGTLQDQLPAWPIFETVVGIVLGVGALYYVVAQRGKADATQVEPDVATGEAVIGQVTDEVLRGELHDTLAAALGRLPELAGRDLVLTVLSGGITNRNFLVAAEGTSDRWVVRLAGNDTHLLGISREVEHAATVAAAGVGVGPEVTAFIRPEGYLVTRFIEGSPVSDEAVRQPETLRRVADSLRRIHDGPAIPGLFVPLRIVEAYRALAIARGVPIPPEYELSAAIGRRIELACLAAPIELRPCHNDLLNANFIDDGARIRIVDWEYAGMGDPFFDLGNFSINHELTVDQDTILLTAYDGSLVPARLARLALFRVVSDFREAMWGVLQQGVSTLDFDFREYAAEHFDRLLANAATPRFEHALSEVAGA